MTIYNLVTPRVHTMQWAGWTYYWMGSGQPWEEEYIEVVW